MSKPKIYVSVPLPKKYSWFTQEQRDRLEAMGDVRWNEKEEQDSPEEFMERIHDADVIITHWGTPRFTDEVLDAAPNLKLIAHDAGSVGYQVDGRVYERGIRVICGNELFADSVAEGTIGYMIAGLRRIPFFSRKVEEIGWSPEGDRWHTGLLYKKVALIGFGAVARNVAKMLSAFKCETYIVADHVTEEEAASYGAKKATMEEAFAECDVVSIHLTNIPETYHIVSRELLNSMKDDALLVNTARGPIIDEDALGDILQTGRIKAVLDVYEVEPLPMDSKLRHLDNVILMPHMGGPCPELTTRVTEAVLTEIPKVLAGEKSWLDVPRDMALRMTR